MKRNFSLIFLISSIFIMFSIADVCSETITVDSVYGKTELVVPDDYATLKEYYIEISQKYLEKRKALKESTDLYSSSKTSYETIIASKDKIISNKDIEIAILKKKPVYVDYINAGVVYNPLLNPNLGLAIGYTGIVYENISFSTYLTFPVSIIFAVGFNF